MVSSSQLIFLALLIVEIAAATPTIAKPGCRSRCGNVDISYPFGMGAKSCYLDEWFKIDCNTTRAFLSKISMEVLNLYYENSTLRVNSPIISSNCPGRKTGRAVNLTRSPFSFADEKNSFFALACNSLGKDCCQVTIRGPLQEFNVIFADDNHPDEKGRERCKRSFVVEDEWIWSKVEDPYEKVQDRDHVPVILKWSVKMNLLGTDERTKLIIDDSGTSFHRVCKEGYSGNPYLQDGCQDIDECQDPQVKKRCRGTCLNTPGSHKCRDPKRWIIILVISVVFGILLLVTGIWWLNKCMKRRNNIKLKEKFFERNGGLLLHQELCSSQGNIKKAEIFSLKELEKATNQFNVNRILGQGGQGTVYKGMLVDGRIVAVKKSKMIDESQLEGFINEVAILSQINHRNVVKLLGCCLETEIPLLVYEFIPHGTLHHYLHEQNVEFQLSWKMRLRIAIEVSGALSYLHSAASIPIYHRDIKSTNILLDQKYRAKVSDFGTSRSIANDQTHVTTNVHGTFGYLDPEYFQSSQFTEKSDVYSFGVVLVELLTGQKPIFETKSREGIGLAAHFIVSMEKDQLFSIIDPRIMRVDDFVKEEILIVAKLAKRCLNLNGKNRPTMKEVTIELEGIQISQNNLNVQQNSESIIYDASSASSSSSFSEVEAFSIDMETESLIYNQTW
ncbi:hypothetical protein P3X46_001106 [Hevea brasiliensis]|uniref:Protein kinase domain-containing protein n=2 Tax=Hevea brasiliensis TaxID=3981 RepID=A0ABQ9ND33_HEVBR|nr:hypothetical protein P3X46_001106 [Hevea brasiliensis]